MLPRIEQPDAFWLTGRGNDPHWEERLPLKLVRPTAEDSNSAALSSVLPIFTYPPWPGALFQDYSVSSSDYSACGANTGNSIRSSRWNTFPFSVIMCLSERGEIIEKGQREWECKAEKQNTLPGLLWYDSIGFESIWQQEVWSQIIMGVTLQLTLTTAIGIFDL